MIVFPAHVALVPAGKPFAASTPSLLIPVAPVVVWVIFVRAVLIHKVGALDPAPAVLAAVTIIVPVAASVVQPPPVKGIE